MTVTPTTSTTTTGTTTTPNTTNNVPSAATLDTAIAPPGLFGGAAAAGSLLPHRLNVPPPQLATMMSSLPPHLLLNAPPPAFGHMVGAQHQQLRAGIGATGAVNMMDADNSVARGAGSQSTSTKPPGCPVGPPPSLMAMRELDSDQEDEEMPIVKATMAARVTATVVASIGSAAQQQQQQDVKKPTSLQQRMLAISGQNIDEFMKEMENVHKKKELERAADLQGRLLAVGAISAVSINPDAPKMAAQTKEDRMPNDGATSGNSDSDDNDDDMNNVVANERARSDKDNEDDDVDENNDADDSDDGDDNGSGDDEDGDDGDNDDDEDNEDSNDSDDSNRKTAKSDKSPKRIATPNSSVPVGTAKADAFDVPLPVRLAGGPPQPPSHPSLLLQQQQQQQMVPGLAIGMPPGNPSMMFRPPPPMRPMGIRVPPGKCLGMLYLEKLV